MQKIGAAFVKRYFLLSPYRENLFLFGVFNFLGLFIVVAVLGLQYFSDDLILLLFTSPSYALRLLSGELFQQFQSSVFPDFFALLLPFYVVSFLMTAVAYKNIEKLVLIEKNLIVALFVFAKFIFFIFALVLVYGFFLDGKYYHSADGVIFVANEFDTLLFMFIVCGVLLFLFGLRLIVQMRNFLRKNVSGQAN